MRDPEDMNLYELASVLHYMTCEEELLWMRLKDGTSVKVRIASTIPGQIMLEAYGTPIAD